MSWPTESNSVRRQETITSDWQMPNYGSYMQVEKKRKKKKKACYLKAQFTGLEDKTNFALGQCCYVVKQSYSQSLTITPFSGKLVAAD